LEAVWLERWPILISFPIKQQRFDGDLKAGPNLTSERILQRNVPDGTFDYFLSRWGTRKAALKTRKISTAAPIPAYRWLQPAEPDIAVMMAASRSSEGRYCIFHASS
jgi:hypothetical protein